MAYGHVCDYFFEGFLFAGMGLVLFVEEFDAEFFDFASSKEFGIAGHVWCIELRIVVMVEVSRFTLTAASHAQEPALTRG